MTLDEVAIELGPKDFAAGLAYVAISRVRTLKGIAFRSAFPLTRLQRQTETESMKMLSEDNTRREGLGFILDTYGMDLSEYVFDDA
jgi:ATP-dependent DNA helicase PIF1